MSISLIGNILRMVHKTFYSLLASFYVLCAFIAEVACIESRNVTSSDGVTIYAEATGNPSKPTLVLIHGFTLSGIVFDKQFLDPTMQDQLYMIRYDMRGHGRSSKPETADSYTSVHYSDDFKAVIQAFNVNHPFVAGWSLGGSVINDITSNLPAGTISGAIEMSSVVSIAVLNQTATPFAFSQLPGILTTNDTALWKNTTIAFVNSFFVHPENIPFEVRMAWQGLGVLVSSTVASFSITKVQDVNTLFQAGRAGLPFLAISGAEDQLINGTAVASLFQQNGFTDLTVVSVPAGGHAFFYERPEITNNALLSFIHKH